MSANNNKLYHNPKCSKSRETLGLLKDKKVEFEVIEYLENPPSINELKYITEKLNKKPIEIIRTKENKFKELGLEVSDIKSDDEWFKIMNENPILIERPIFIYNDNVTIGRPPENVLSIIQEN